MAEPTIIDLKNCLVKLVDGTTPTAKSLTLIMDEGTLTFEVGQNIEYKKDRGKLSGTRKGDEEPMKVSFQGRFSKLLTDTVGGETILSPFEFLTQEGQASTNVTVGNACEPYAVDIVVEITSPCGTVADEVDTFPEFRMESFGGNYKDGTISVSGRCNAEFPTVVRS